LCTSWPVSSVEGIIYKKIMLSFEFFVDDAFKIAHDCFVDDAFNIADWPGGAQLIS